MEAPLSDEVHDEGVPAAGVATEGDVSAANDEVLTADEEPSIPSPTPPTPPPQPSQDIPSTSQQRVKKLERRNKVKVLKLRRLQKVGTTQRINTSDDIVMDDVSNQGRMIAEMDQDADVVLEKAKDVTADIAKSDQDAKVDESVDIQGRKAKPKQKSIRLIWIMLTSSATTVAAPKLTAAPSRRIKGVVIRDVEESTTTTTSTIIHTEAKSKDKGKRNLVEEPKPLKKQAQIEKISNMLGTLKRKPQTEAQAIKNMMIYLKNVASFKMDYFKGMSYDDICPVFERYLESNVAFLQKIKEQIDEEESRALKRINETLAEKAKKLILLVEREYPLTRFTLDQMLNNVRLEVKEESEVSLELL
nr:hypothetical protein [Tanacetum cinerariifolium]